jgi:Periplasmic copper-binding protein (NosD)/Bacterial Ig-like domain (group 2)/Dockerin type I domain
MRRACVMAGLGLLIAGGRLPAQTVVFGVGGELSGVRSGDVRVPVYVDMRGAPGQKLGSFTARLAWDPTVLYPYNGTDDITQGRFGNVVVDVDSLYAGVLTVGGISAVGLDSVFDLFALRLRVLKDSTIPVTLTVTEAAAAGTFADLTPFVTALGSTYCPAVGRWGDVDADGVANSRDALAMLSAIVGLPLDPSFTIALGDVDGDGVVNSRDALITLSYSVGLDIPGQRVLVLVPGACGTGGSTGLTLVPDTVDVVVGQRMQMLVLGAASGTPSAAAISWATANPEVAGVTADGLLAGNGPGTTTVTAAIGPGIRASVPVTVRTRRQVWHVDAHIAQFAAIQMGTTRYPFASPQYAFPLVADGDTILVAPGTHDFVNASNCYDLYCAAALGPRASVVLMGETLPDGTRPVLRGTPDADQGIVVDIGIRLEVRDLEFRNFSQYAIRYYDYYDGPPRGPLAAGAAQAQGGATSARVLALDNVRVVLGQYGGGIYGTGMDTLAIRRSELSCPATAPYCEQPVYVGGVRYTEIDSTRFEAPGGQSYSQIEIYDADSVVVRRSTFLGLTSLYVDGDPNRGGVQLTVTGNRFSDSSAVAGAYYSYYSGVQGYDVRTASLDHNVFDRRNGGDYPVELYALNPLQVGSSFRMLGDSIAVRDTSTSAARWFYADNFDSVSVDSLQATFAAGTQYPNGGSLYGHNVRVTDSHFLGAQTGLEVGADTLQVTGATFTRCVGCASPGSGQGLDAYALNDSLRFLQVSGSSFSGFQYGVYAYTGTFLRTADLIGNTVDSVRYGFYVYADSARIHDNVFTRATTPVILADYPPLANKGASILRNQITCTRGVWGTTDTRALQLTSISVRADSNQITGCRIGVQYATYDANVPHALAMRGNTITSDTTTTDTEYGLFLPNEVSATLRHNRIVGGSNGIELTGTAAHTLDSNVVVGTWVRAIAATGSGDVTGRWNNLKNNVIGFYSGGTGVRSFTDGRFVGNTSYAVDQTGATPVTASANWWGDPAGPGGGIADSVFGTVSTGGFLLTDPEGVSVPTAPPAFGAVAVRPDALPPLPIRGRVLGLPPSATAAVEPTPADRARAREARRADALRRHEEARARAQQRLDQSRTRHP